MNADTTNAAAEPEKKLEALHLFATVYDHAVTELRWSERLRQYRAFSNIDFNHFAGVFDIETADTVYMLLLGLGNQTREQAEPERREIGEQPLPPPQSFNQSRAEYRLVGIDPQAPASTAGLKGLDALHRFYDANRERLAAAYATRIEQERRQKANPPAPKHTVINFWPKKSTNYPTP